MIRRSCCSGFSLTELVVAMAILGIVSAVALPAYQQSLRKSRRSDARILLITSAQRLEQCYAECDSYTAACVASCPPPLARKSPGGFYEVRTEGISLSAHAYALVATPARGSPQTRDGDCASFALAHTGARSATGTAAAGCW